VGYAGMKDKAARTTQTFSLDFGQPLPEMAQAAQAAAERIGAELPVTVHWARWHRNKLKPGHLLGNRFRITVTQLACSGEEALARGWAVAERLQQVGLPNYYGPQRFGIGGGNVGQGQDILLGRRHERDRWRRQFMIAAYQSYLCNRYLARRVEMNAFERLLAGDIAKKHATGGLFEVTDLAAEQPRYQAQEISFTAPMFGAKLWSAVDEAGELEASVLAATPVTVEHFARARVEGTRRLGRVLLPSLELKATADGIEVIFELPKGAFATTVLREFMKVEMGAAAAMDEDE
jgi:tRNA pseudouridine13 synthase